MSPQILITYCNNNNNSLSPNVFDESPLIFQAKKDNFLNYLKRLTLHVLYMLYMSYMLNTLYIYIIHYSFTLVFYKSSYCLPN